MINPVHSPTSTSSEDSILRLDQRIEDGACVVVATGEIDLASAPALKAVLADELRQGRRLFVLDLSELHHLDSTGLGVLVGLRRKLDGEGGVAIAGARPNVNALFELTGLDQSFAVLPSVADAVAHVRWLAAPERHAALTADAAIVVGLASTALPFADSRVAEVERWLRVLRVHGDSSHALFSLGLSEAPAAGLSQAGDAEDGSGDARDRIAAVTERAKRIAAGRGDAGAGTGDLLLAVMDVYGEDFDRVLRAFDGEPGELRELLEFLPTAVAGA